MEEETAVKVDQPFKLNIKRTIFIAFAFFGILLVWQLYNSYCAGFLTFLFAKKDFGNAISTSDSKEILKALGEEAYRKVQFKVGIVMALDNIAALFLMPIFGSLSDKTKTKMGKRMPYILIGSVVTAIALPFIPFAFGSWNKNITAALVGLICAMVIVIVFMMMYRSPAVALMPDLTPKPLRSKANGIINIVGYVGGFIGSLFAMVLPLSKYLDGSNQSFFMLMIPFIVTSIVLLASLVVLLIKIKENKLNEELREEIKRGDSVTETSDKVEEGGKLSKSNLRNLALILVAEVFWFMSLNAIETFQGNYVMLYLNCSSAGGAAMTIIQGAASIIGFLTAGFIADKIGRKWTIFIGICLVTACYIAYSFIPSHLDGLAKDSAGHIIYTLDYKLPWIFYVLLPLIGYGTSLIHICSFPLVTDYCTAEKVGKFTSIYYAASMIAQSITPIVIGSIFFVTSWQALPIYSASLMGVAGLVFFFVKAPFVKKGGNVKGLEALGADD